MKKVLKKSGFDHSEDDLDMIEMGKTAKRLVDSIKLSRYVCSLTVQNPARSKKLVDYLVSQFVIPSRNYSGGAIPYALTVHGQVSSAWQFISGLLRKNTKSGPSLKDLGKKWFAFSKMDSQTLEIINLLKIKINE